jgi:predicted dehydrogenase
MEDSMKKLRTGVLGCGIFARQHASILAALADDIDLAAFCDRHPERAGAYAHEFTGGQAAVYTSHAQMIDEAGLDLLFICLPPHGHTDEVERAAAKGIHMLIEKPIALTSEQAWQMVQWSESAGVKTQVGFMFRFGEAIERLKNLLDSGQVGPVGLMSARYFCNHLHAGWWREREKSGGQLVEQVIHMVDLMRYLMGEPSTVVARMANLFHQDVERYTIEDNSASLFGFPNSASAVIYASNSAIPNQWINDYRVVAGGLTAEFQNANSAQFTFTADPSSLVVEQIAGTRDFYLAQTLNLIQAIRTDGSTRTPMREGALTLDLALAAARSAELGQVVGL